ncbi:MAG: response regulator [Victivallales bacterium]|nr:response regulator [Victivallales bacterium]
MADTTTKKVLIIDDDDEIRSEIIAVLEEFGHSYEEASNILEARQKLYGMDFDYVLLDMELPSRYGKPLLRENGENFLKEIRMRFSADELPVIIVTGTVPESEKASALLFDGAFAFVKKPISTGHPTLREAIQKYLSRTPKKETIERQTNDSLAVHEAPAEYRVQPELWLEMEKNGRKSITWRTWTQGGLVHMVQEMATKRIACKILRQLHKALPGDGFVQDDDIMKAGCWSPKEYFTTTKRGKVVAYNGIARNRLSEIKKELGIDFRFEPGGVRFFQPQ